MWRYGLVPPQGSYFVRTLSSFFINAESLLLTSMKFYINLLLFSKIWSGRTLAHLSQDPIIISLKIFNSRACLIFQLKHKDGRSIPAIRHPFLMTWLKIKKPLLHWHNLLTSKRICCFPCPLLSVLLMVWYWHFCCSGLAALYRLLLTVVAFAVCAAMASAANAAKAFPTSLRWRAG